MGIRVISNVTERHLHQTVAAQRGLRSTLPGSSSARGVFKKSRNIADLQRPGRDLAKDNVDTGTIASLTKSLDQSDRFGAVFSACGRISAESLPAVLGTSHPRLMPIGRVARELCFGSDRASVVASNCSDPININLTAVAGAGHPTAPLLRQTNNSSGWLCKAAQRVRSAIDGVMIHFGVLNEKYGYAGV
uniref:Uncharacterized protein n=1 Tax=Rhodopseudomonas palustris (strain BisA53) TaxID=316055 RepID=Q07NC6_RHOP5